LLAPLAPLAPAALDIFLELLRKAHGLTLSRVKGILALGDDPSRPFVIRASQDGRISPAAAAYGLA
jgi:G3E family GTPase